MAERNYEYQRVGSDVVSVNQDQVHKMEARPEPGQPWRQYLIAAFVNIGIACTGYSMGWSSPIHVILGNVTTSPLDEVVTTDQEAWIGSLLAVGAIFGPFLAGSAVSTIGRKWGLITSCLPLLIGWLLILFTSNVGMIYAGRFFWGLSGGMIFTISPMYCAEIATDESRGSLGSFLQLFCTIGFLLVYCIGPFSSYTAIAYFGLAMAVVYCVGLFFIPETPFFFLAKMFSVCTKYWYSAYNFPDDKVAATECLAKIRGQATKAVQSEINKMDAEVAISMSRTATLADIFRGSNFKAFYISCALLFFQQFSGINAVLFYMSSIFEASGASLDSSISTIIIGTVLVGASCITPLVVDKLGRRILLFISTSGTAIGLGLLGVYFILADNGSPIVASLGFLPVLALVLFIVSYCAGVGPLPWAILAELLPIEVKTTASPIATAFCWILTFLTTRFFSSFANAIGMGSTFLVFGVCCVLGIFFTMFLVPETKGKSFQEIQDMLAGKSSSSHRSSEKA